MMPVNNRNYSFNMTALVFNENQLHDIKNAVWQNF